MSKSTRKSPRVHQGPALPRRQRRAEKWSRIGLLLVGGLLVLGLMAGRACA